ncbi:MAG: NADP-specific glutamate dehydrogenase [Bacilli bacterium]|jgi:glutamate dehydrogenase (NADP+)|nr:NADP-specific glutamate dehydrogenase [Bacilli bacterium]MDD3348839.1 NADP-specific glutamate dehydrogenase [Bacilli bacterium]
MFESSYLNKVYNELLIKSKNEPEFLQAVEEFLKSIDLIIQDHPDIEKYSIVERIVEPERIIMFRVPWVDDNNEIKVNRGFRVQFNSAIGPYKGGIRFDKSVTLSIMKFLGFEQMFKNSLTGLPMGGGKGGSDFSPTGKSDHEIMRFCQSFMSELYRHIGADLDVPAGDFGVGAREIGYLFGYYKKLKNEFTGAFTGKGLSFGGSLVRREATGYGVCYFAEEILKNIKNDSLKGKRVIVTGSGNVGTYTAMKAVELGAKVIAMSDISGYIYDENGVDVNYVRDIKEKQKKNLDSYLMYQPSCKFVPDYKSVWTIKADIIFPCATQNELGIEEAKKIVANGTMMVCEGANMPTTIEATDYLMDHNILFAPGKAANAGGVATSGLEMSQNSMRFSWTAAEVDSKLHSIMENIFETCYNTAKKVGKEGNLVVGANIAGFLKIYEAMVAEGVI